MTVNTDPKLIERLLTRGVEMIYPTREFLEKKLKSGERMRIYVGVDPTGPMLHLGHAIPLRKLRQFQDLGHEVILLVGDFTAQIGDPTGKNSTRKALTKHEIRTNFRSYKKQAGKILDFKLFGGADVKFNSSWTNTLSPANLLEIASLFTNAQLLERDMFQKRIQEGAPIFEHEILYPVFQAYDSVAMDVDGEIGGNDQTFNMLRGRDLLKSMRGKEKCVVTTKLLTDSSGTKMGKTEGNMVTLIDSPEDMFGKIMSWTDGLIAGGFELCTDLDIPSDAEISADPKGMKMKLAHEIVRMYHSEALADIAQEKWIKTFSKKEVPDDMEEVSASADALLADVLTGAGIVSSKTNFRQLVGEGAITDLDTNEKITDEKITITKPLRLKIGKKRFVRIRL